MADQFLVQLNDRWRLLYDGRQWILARDAGRANGRYTPLRFLTIKAVLLRDMRELRIEPTPEAMAVINALPAHRREWTAPAEAVARASGERSQRDHAVGDTPMLADPVSTS